MIDLDDLEAKSRAVAENYPGARFFLEGCNCCVYLDGCDYFDGMVASQRPHDIAAHIAAANPAAVLELVREVRALRKSLIEHRCKFTDTCECWDISRALEPGE